MGRCETHSDSDSVCRPIELISDILFGMSYDARSVNEKFCEKFCESCGAGEQKKERKVALCRNESLVEGKRQGDCLDVSNSLTPSGLGLRNKYFCTPPQTPDGTKTVITPRHLTLFRRGFQGPTFQLALYNFAKNRYLPQNLPKKEIWGPEV